MLTTRLTSRLMRAILLAILVAPMLLAWVLPGSAQAQIQGQSPASSGAGVRVVEEAGTGAPAAYQLHAGDEVAVRFPLNPELDTTGAIGPDGRLSLPLLGRVVLAGLSLDEAERQIETALREAAIVADAKASLSVSSYAGVVYVGGEVARPGAVPITAALNPLQAIIEAGGLRPTAKSRRVAVIRAAEDGTAQVYPVNVRTFIRAGTGDDGVRLQPGDIVFVPRSGIAEVGLFMDQYVNALVPNAFNIFYNLGAGGAGVNVVDPAP